MKLLLYYFYSFFHLLEIPSGKEICGKDITLVSYCDFSISFLNYFIIFCVLYLIYSFRKSAANRVITLLPVVLFAAFYITDACLKSLSQPEKFGIEWFIILYHIWMILFISFVCLTLCYSENVKKNFIILGVITLILEIFLVTFGRGTVEQSNEIIGKLLFELSLDALWSAKIVKLVIFSLAIAVAYGSGNYVLFWIKKGVFVPKKFIKPVLNTLVFTPLTLLIVFSIFFGKYINQYDVAKAKIFIDDIKKQADKYYYENGEYPRSLGDIIDEEKPNPWLLARHEFFTMGVRGTYYFSRPEKYCFIFQNPNLAFGYYSLTSERGWKYSRLDKNYDDVYINLCDETTKSQEQLVANQLGLENPDDYVNQLAVQFDVPRVLPAQTDGVGKKLHQEILKVGEEDPTIFKYYRDAPEEYRKNRE